MDGLTEEKQLQILIEKFKSSTKNGKWVIMLEELSSLLPNALVTLNISSDSQDMLKTLVEWACHALDFDEAIKLPVGMNIRQLKAGIKLASRLCRCNEEVSKIMMVGSRVFVSCFVLVLLSYLHTSRPIRLPR